MSTPKALILRAPGINCERETYDAYERAGANSEYLHIKKLLAQPELLDQYSILAVPGGFSYGDDISSGRVLAQEMKQKLGERVLNFVERRLMTARHQLWRRPLLHQLQRGATERSDGGMFALCVLKPERRQTIPNRLRHSVRSRVVWGLRMLPCPTGHDRCDHTGAPIQQGTPAGTGNDPVIDTNVGLALEARGLGRAVNQLRNHPVPFFHRQPGRIR